MKSMEINTEKLKELSLADLLYLQNSITNMDNPYFFHVSNSLSEEIALRVNSVFPEIDANYLKAYYL